MFSSLSFASKEPLARRLVRDRSPPGTEAITEGDHGDRFDVVGEGEANVTEAEHYRRTHGRGDFFGEISLLRDVPGRPP